MPKLRHIAIAAKDPDAMAEFYVKAFDFKIVRSNDGPLAYGHHLSDGTIDLAILRFKTDQLGRGLDYTGLHHFGILVEDVDEAGKKLEALGGRHYMDQSEADADRRLRGQDVRPRRHPVRHGRASLDRHRAAPGRARAGRTRAGRSRRIAGNTVAAGVCGRSPCRRARHGCGTCRRALIAMFDTPSTRASQGARLPPVEFSGEQRSVPSSRNFPG